MNDLLSTEIYNGKTLGDFVSLEFLVSVFGSMLSAILVLFVGFVIAGWVARRIEAWRRRTRASTTRSSTSSPTSRATSSSACRS